jgi:hypothetical protein
MQNCHIGSNYHQPMLESIITDVSAIIIRPWVSAIEYSFDSYWGELELSIIVDSDVSDRHLIELRNEILSFIQRKYPEDDISFEWRIVLMRSNKIVEVLLNEDTKIDVNAKLTELAI